MQLADLLKILSVVPQTVAQMDEFRELYRLGVNALGSGSDQQTARQAYELAYSGAAKDHEDLQVLVRQHTGEGSGGSTIGS